MIAVAMVVSLSWCIHGAAGSEFSADVRDFGARGDGVTDSAPAIQAAIDAAGEKGGRVVIPPAEKPYLLKQTLVVRRSNVTIEGTGARLLFADGASAGKTAHALWVRGKEDTPLVGVTLRGFDLDANYWNQRDAYRPRGIQCDWAQNVLIERVTVRRAWVGITYGLGVANSEIRDSVATQWHNDGFDVSGEGLNKTHHIRFVRCQAVDSPDEQAGGLPGNRDDAFEIEDGCTDVEIIECLARSAGGKGFGVRSHDRYPKLRMSGIHFKRCRAEGMGGYGWLARGTNANITLDNVSLRDCSSNSPCAFFEGITRLSMVNCQFSAPVYLGMESKSDKHQWLRTRPIASGTFDACRFAELFLNLPKRFDGRDPLTFRECDVEKCTIFGDRGGLTLHETRLPSS